ncbi:Uncharacterised protein [Mycobacterium tuberculosis]|nr:Uncharacterised protein [Mycobacterium tuberculosis]
MSETALGGIYVLLFFVIIGVLLYLGVKYVDPIIGRINASRRSRELETEMRQKMYDDAERRRIAEKLLREENERRERGY